MHFTNGSWFRSTLFIFVLFYSNFCVSFDADILSKVANTSTWNRLIHGWEGKAQITDSSFLLSSGQFSPSLELEKTLALIQSDLTAAYCRFPARVTFLASELKFTLPKELMAQCGELKRFIEFVPFQKLELVFSSEVTSSASSMMGHIFLKASGHNSGGSEVAHSLAYFTEIKTLNPLKLMYQSLISGMEGYFLVRPFYKDVIQYKENEQRNLWQFELDADPDAIKLLQLHLWELKEVDITYYFQSFNCATLTLEMLALLKPDVLLERSLFVSPVDVVKAALNKDLVKSTNIDTSDTWLFAALIDVMDVDAVKNIRKIAENPERWQASLNSETSDLEVEFAQVLFRHTLDQQLEPLTAHQLEIKAWQESLSGSRFDFSRYKHPALTPQDSAIGLKYIGNDENGTINFSFLGSGHYLFGDNRQYLSESELIILKANVEYELNKQSWDLDELTLYSMKSYLAGNDISPVLSSELYLGYRTSYDDLLDSHAALEFSGAIGKSYRIHRDILSYSLLGAGLAADLSMLNSFYQVKTGLIANLVYDLKLIVEAEHNSGKLRHTSSQNTLSFGLNWYPSQDISISFFAQSLHGTQQQKSILSLELNHYF